MAHAIESATRRQRFRSTEQDRIERELRRIDRMIKRYRDSLAEYDRDRSRLVAELRAIQREGK